MLDIWAFLLQTLTVSGAAALILLLKALFKDKLPPKWQFAVWGVLGMICLVPAGIGGRYTLFNWRVAVETLKSTFGDYSFTRVFFPLPVLTSAPATAAEWIFAVYFLGVLVHLLVYAVSYVRLRRVLRLADTISGENAAKIQAIAEKLNVKPAKAVEISGLGGAFVCGVFRPVLVLPAAEDIDEKIILHELYHLKNKDTLWSIVICAFRSVHWCNPLAVFCAGRALNDMEQRCDQYVLETLEGEERRKYGHILLAMASEKFSGTPGSTSIGNGGKNIKTRIENIARFKKYPKGMRLVSVCVLVLLVFPLAMGTKALSLTEFENSVYLTLASARSTPCVSAAGAFDAYGKAVLTRNGYYRAMCAPEGMQAALSAEIFEKTALGVAHTWDTGLDAFPETSKGYYIYNLKQIDDKAYEGLFVIELSTPPDGAEAELNKAYIAYQALRVEKENGRWVALPLEDFKYMETFSRNLLWGCIGLPCITYAGQANDMRVEITYQTVHIVESSITNQSFFGSSSYYDTTPKPSTLFTYGTNDYSTTVFYLGSEAGKDAITHIGLSTSPVYAGEEEPKNLPGPSGDHTTRYSDDGRMWLSKELYSGWSSEIDIGMDMGGGGSSFAADKEVKHPEYFLADLYLNNKKVARFSLTLQEGAAK